MSRNVTVQQDIPISFTTSVDRPFDPIGIRDLSAPGYDRNNQRLSDQQVEDLIKNPPPIKDPNERLNTLSKGDNDKKQAEFESEKIYNLSLSQLASRTTKTVHDVLDDLVNFNPQDGIRGMLQIFTQSDRLMYIGIIVIVFTILILLFKSKDD
jgi:hypothetical protein